MAGHVKESVSEGLLGIGLRRLRHGVGWRLTKYRWVVSQLWSRTVARGVISWRWQIRSEGRAHALPGQLIVSLTSYPPRYPTLALTLKCLLCQSVQADKTVLWIAAEDIGSLPKAVTDLRADGLEIRPCKNNRSYKKIIPTLAAFPQAFIVTADDDVYYSSRWLEKLVAAVGEKTIVCHRAHAVKFDDLGNPAPYKEWHFDKSEASPVLFPTGVGGILYPPGSLAPEVSDEDKFLNLCPNADDVWLFWMGRRAGSSYIMLGKSWSPIHWKGTQASALHLTNAGLGGNDEQIKRMMGEYGFPSKEASYEQAA
ncbi:hypothetical protein ACFX5Q_18180 [Mesorhizobium sp. IMUNJ 23033]|uniref:hypothetical protein n=1 Tax=Mesorhizobium sp. IMUNJ 23033 TaxID=3378039 RepID=UPI00384BED68